MGLHSSKAVFHTLRFSGGYIHEAPKQSVCLLLVHHLLCPQNLTVDIDLGMSVPGLLVCLQLELVRGSKWGESSAGQCHLADEDYYVY